jgi:hypothetical protein
MSASPTVIVYNLGWMDNLVNARNWRLNKTISNQLKVHAFQVSKKRGQKLQQPHTISQAEKITKGRIMEEYVSMSMSLEMSK